MNQSSERYLEDFEVGQTFGSGWLRIDGERARAFAAEFDPQPFHLVVNLVVPRRNGVRMQ
jgi:acyl dehydratase